MELHEIVDNKEFKTNQNENFLLVNSKETNIVGFSTLSNLKVLCNSDTIFVDGTLKSCPILYHQLFTVHCTINQSYVPLVYILLPSKTTQCYLQAFQHLVIECKKK
uniref:MULE transposase domain-containing protein n=1 Tax=Schizaphis graminum TaxID=13262 RepID=A0A2S2PHE5_SCHGA